MTDIRTRLVEIAEGFVGCSAAPETRARYLELVAGPGDTEPGQRAYLCAPKTSGCALVVRGIWRAAGLADRRLVERYVPGRAVSDVVAIAHAAGGWVTDLSRLPLPGDVILVGDNGAGGIEHVATITSTTSTGSFESVDGGQRDSAGQQAIRAKVRTWTRRADGTVWDRARLASDPGGAAPRIVRGFVDVSRLFPDVEAAPPTPRNTGAPARRTLRKGDRGEDVAELQRRLLCLPADGIFGPATEAAVKAFQTSAGLKVDGVVGPRTWAAIGA